MGSRPRLRCPAYPGWHCRNLGVRAAGQRGHPPSPTRGGAGVREAARGRRSVPWARVRPCFDCTRSLLRDQTDEVGTHLCTRVRERFARSCTSSQGVEINPASRPISSLTHTLSNWSGVTVNTHTHAPGRASDVTTDTAPSEGLTAVCPGRHVSRVAPRVIAAPRSTLDIGSGLGTRHPWHIRGDSPTAPGSCR